MKWFNPLSLGSGEDPSVSSGVQTNKTQSGITFICFILQVSLTYPCHSVYNLVLKLFFEHSIFMGCIASRWV